MPGLDPLRLRLANVDAVVSLAIVGLLCGVFSGLVIVAFRYLIAGGEWLLTGTQDGSGFEQTEPWLRLVMATLGGVAIGLVLHWLKPAHRAVGMAHVMERMAYHQGYLPWRNIVAQFFLGATALISGQSVGREGPSVHLGAGSGSWLGKQLHFPNNSIRTLVACGTAAAIAASFDTPLAGVIFAMEVVMMEYTIRGFIPVILAAVSGAVIAQLFYGKDVAFSVPALQLHSLGELPLFIVLGLVIGALASAFIILTVLIARCRTHLPIWCQASVAGVGVGLLAMMVPEVMGLGYDTTNLALAGQILWPLLLLILVAKFLATSLCVGMGTPGGVIGPTLVMGAMLGGALGLVGEQLVPGMLSHSGYYAIIGMAAFMSATLQAPLAALIALLELTGNPHILLPGMLTVIIANLTVSQGFRQSALFDSLMSSQGRALQLDPVKQILRRIGVASIIDRAYVQTERLLLREQAQAIINRVNAPRWLVVNKDNAPFRLMPVIDLARALEQSEDEEIDLMAIPGARYPLVAIDFQATLDEALDKLAEEQGEAIYVYRFTALNVRLIYGVITLADIEQHYLYRRR